MKPHIVIILILTILAPGSLCKLYAKERFQAPNYVESELTFEIRNVSKNLFGSADGIYSAPFKFPSPLRDVAKLWLHVYINGRNFVNPQFNLKLNAIGSLNGTIEFATQYHFMHINGTQLRYPVYAPNNCSDVSIPLIQ